VSRAAWELRRLLRDAGVTGVIGLACALAGVAVVLIGIEPTVEAIGVEEQSLTKLQSRAAHARRGADSGPQTTPDRLKAFYAFFPGVEALPDWLDKVFAAAKQHSVTLEKGEYTLVRDKDGKLMRYQLLLPLKASYPQVRGFLENVLQEVPAVALDSVTFQRESIAAPQVEAQVRFTLMLGGS